VVTENAAICAYLADAFPQAGLAPAPGDPERGPYYRWLFFAAAPLEAAVTNRTLGVDVAPEQQRMAGYGSYERVLQTLESVLDGREHLAGGRFSAADLYLGAHLDWGMRFGTIEARPAFERFVAPLRQRPAYLRAAEIDDALVAAQQR
jgi:glutathione S-transferase